MDIIHNLNKYPWPFKDNSIDEIYADNVLEHLDSIINPVEEMWRITKNNGVIKIIVPYTPSVWAFIDPTHKQFYTYLTFNYFTEECNLNYYSKARFKIIKRKIKFSKLLKILEYIVNLNKLFKKIYFRFFSFLIPATMIEVELKVIKKQ